LKKRSFKLTVIWHKLDHWAYVWWYVPVVDWIWANNNVYTNENVPESFVCGINALLKMFALAWKSKFFWKSRSQQNQTKCEVQWHFAVERIVVLLLMKCIIFGLHQQMTWALFESWVFIFVQFVQCTIVQSTMKKINSFGWLKLLGKMDISVLVKFFGNIKPFDYTKRSAFFHE
jgi:hypothetical protein